MDEYNPLGDSGSCIEMGSCTEMQPEVGPAEYSLTVHYSSAVTLGWPNRPIYLCAGLLDLTNGMKLEWYAVRG